MPILFEFFQDHNLFVSTWTGELTDDDLWPAYQQLFSNDAYHPGMNELADMRKVTLSRVTGAGMLHLGEHMGHWLEGKCEGFKTAVIAPKDLSYGLSRIYEFQSYDTVENTRVFRDPDEAIKWLGVEQGYL